MSRPLQHPRPNTQNQPRRDARFSPYHRPDTGPVPYEIFDFTKAADSFPNVNNRVNDEFSKLILKRNRELSPSAEDQAALASLSRRVSFALDNLSIASSQELPLLEDKRVVGSYKNGTIIKGHNIVDIAVIFKDHPNLIDVERLGKRVVEILIENAIDENERDVEMEMNELGIFVDIITKSYRARLLTSTGFHSIKKTCDSNDVDSKSILQVLTAVQHARWFDETANYTNIRIAVIIFKDLRRRIPPLEQLSIWMIELLAHYAAFDKNQHLLEVGAVIRRMFRLLASGIFLPGSASIMDPCQNKNSRVNSKMSFEDMDKVACLAQTLLRLISHGYYQKLLSENDEVILDSPITFGDVTITPSTAVYSNNKKEEPANSEGHTET
ncbi:Interleukin enhancer-binding factor 2 [Trichoplax sp. H2]|nr:Interleukin enhancer-binding factor 2 [Trichoplax sp. H2]|eukprot:RDD46623.1 Interleukin enhancer-binding factor 2 [Trichoplax sp. H2]